MKFENTKVFNFEGAFRGMRNPKESWDRSDSFFGLIDFKNSEADYEIAHKWTKIKYPNYTQLFIDETPESNKLFYEYDQWLIKNGILDIDEYELYGHAAFIGPNDMKLAQTLIRAGSEHRKFLRQIFVCVDITAPIYWWKEFDTYKVGTVANSTSTMHKLCSKPLTIEDFSMDCLTDISNDYPDQTIAETMVNLCENYRKEFLRTKSKRVWKALIQLLPESFNQTRTVTMNYENLFTIYNHRKNHKLTEWANDFIEWEKTLPYANELIFIEKEEN